MGPDKSIFGAPVGILATAMSGYIGADHTFASDESIKRPSTCPSHRLTDLVVVIPTQAISHGHGDIRVRSQPGSAVRVKPHAIPEYV